VRRMMQRSTKCLPGSDASVDVVQEAAQRMPKVDPKARTSGVMAEE
jgi:hypothetical protein